MDREVIAEKIESLRRCLMRAHAIATRNLSDFSDFAQAVVEKIRV
jgi:hypothetical protein